MTPKRLMDKTREKENFSSSVKAIIWKRFMILRYRMKHILVSYLHTDALLTRYHIYKIIFLPILIFFFFILHNGRSLSHVSFERGRYSLACL